MSPSGAIRSASVARPVYVAIRVAIRIEYLDKFVRHRKPRGRFRRGEVYSSCRKVTSRDEGDYPASDQELWLAAMPFPHHGATGTIDVKLAIYCQLYYAEPKLICTSLLSRSPSRAGAKVAIESPTSRDELSPTGSLRVSEPLLIDRQGKRIEVAIVG